MTYFKFYHVLKDEGLTLKQAAAVSFIISKNASAAQCVRMLNVTFDTIRTALNKLRASGFLSADNKLSAEAAKKLLTGFWRIPQHLVSNLGFIEAIKACALMEFKTHCAAARALGGWRIRFKYTHNEIMRIFKSLGLRKFNLTKPSAKKKCKMPSFIELKKQLATMREYARLIGIKVGRGCGLRRYKVYSLLARLRYN